MKKLKMITAAALLVLLSTQCFGEHKYKVRKNDSLWKIAKREYGLRKNKDIDKAWRLIANANEISDPSKIRPGQVLTIPTKGTKSKKTGPFTPKGFAYVKTVHMKVTGYCKCAICCETHANGKTSIGDSAYVLNGVAADPRAIPYRWKVYVPGKGFREVDDTGGAMRRSWIRGIYHIDVRFASHRKASKYNKWLDVKIYRKKPKKETVLASVTNRGS